MSAQKVVIDTNVFVSSFFGGNPRKVIDLWKTGEILLCVSKSILDEYVRVLQRLGLKDEEALAAMLKLFAEGFNLLFTARTPSLFIVDNDPDDNKFIECAVALESSIIVSGDKHLLSIRDYMGIQILSSADFLSYRQASSL